MDIKSRIIEINSEVLGLEKQSQKLQSQAYSLRQKREALVSSLILDGNLLNGTEWDLYLHGDNSVYLQLTKDNEENSLHLIIELINMSYHARFDIEPDIEIHFDDNQISLHFNENKRITRFVKNNKLIINGSGVKDRLKKLKQDVVALELICHQFASIL